jgi:hypothetical protein
MGNLKDEFQAELKRLKEVSGNSPSSSREFAARRMDAVREAATLVFELGPFDPTSKRVEELVGQLEVFHGDPGSTATEIMAELNDLLQRAEKEKVASHLMQPASEPIDNYGVAIDYSGFGS